MIERLIAMAALVLLRWWLQSRPRRVDLVLPPTKEREYEVERHRLALQVQSLRGALLGIAKDADADADTLRATARANVEAGGGKVNA